jgi:hypothetical protein
MLSEEPERDCNPLEEILEEDDGGSVYGGISVCIGADVVK